jgi:hypothetical protein
MTRRHYPECHVVVSAWEEQAALDCEDAEVWIEDESILVSYFDEDGIVVLEGLSDRNGGWTLMARSRARRATLSPVAGEEAVLRGSIDEMGHTVDWTLRLGDREVDGEIDRETDRESLDPPPTDSSAAEMKR